MFHNKEFIVKKYTSTDKKHFSENKRSNLRGNLTVPEHEPIISSEPAIIMRAKKGSYLHSSPATDLKKQNDDNLDNFSHPLPNINYTKTPFNESIQVLATPTDPSKQYYNVATFERIGRPIPGMPESGNEIKILQKGWMQAKDLKKDKESFIAFSGDIFQGKNEFSNKPDPQAVNQTWIADCFLLSTAISVLHNQYGMNFLTEMMRQCDDGTTIVRLYHPKTLQPHYIRVTNSYHSINNQSTVAHSQPWIHLLEKAYAIFAFNSKEESDFPSFLSIFGSGGDSSVAFKILTGKKAERINMQETTLCNPLESESVLAAIQIAEATGEKREELLAKHRQLYSHFKEDKATLLQWGRFLIKLRNSAHPEFWQLILPDSTYSNVKNIDESIEKLSAITFTEESITLEDKSMVLENKTYAYEDKCKNLENISNICEDKHNIPKTISFAHEQKLNLSKYTTSVNENTHKDLEDKFNYSENKLTISENNSINSEEKYLTSQEEFSLTPKMVGILKNSASPINGPKNRIFYPTPENAHEGQYTKYHYEIYDKLDECSNQNILMTASTHGVFEEKVSGLVAKHEYSILGVYERHYKNKTLLMVRLRNPWGYMGCRYNESGQFEEEKEYPVFDLNIADFTKYFLSFSICEAPIIAPLNLKKFNLKPTYSNLSLLHEKIKIQFNAVFNNDNKNNVEHLQKTLLKEITKLSFSKLETYLKYTDEFKFLLADFLELERISKQANDNLDFKSARELVLNFLTKLNNIILIIPISKNTEALYKNLVSHSQEYQDSLQKKIEEYVKEKHPGLYMEYSLDRLIKIENGSSKESKMNMEFNRESKMESGFNKESKMQSRFNKESKTKSRFNIIKMESGFNIDAFINQENRIIMQENSIFRLNIKKYKIMKKANDILKANKPIPAKLHVFSQIMKANEKLLSNDPWYYIILKTLATVTAALLTVGLASIPVYRYFFGKSSNPSKKFINNIKPDLEQITKLSFRNW
ncbi:MAG: hypothetical protein JO131_06870 [Gammaproteobacteria bacterium]|nr:hypothetical protein [Gammaproteobacteria bacterium]